jgi:eukaryotic-like serine/threonine-protein kinase
MTSPDGPDDAATGVLPEGTVIGGRYRIASAIGDGAHSVVYLARTVPDGEEVAVKVIHPHLSGDRQVARRFQREARILARLEGENIVKMLDFIQEDGLLALVLERAPGVSLAHILAEHRPLDMDAAVEITLQVCAALGAAHASDIVHRDLKTANVLVDWPEADGAASSARASAAGIRVKVVDFGLSKVLEGDLNPALTDHGMIFGTPEYMSPEQARGEEVDARTDLYAAGIMLYEMAVGAPPFSRRSPVDTMAAHLSEAPPSPRALRPGSSITAALEAVILRALSKEPADRYPSARELAQAITTARDQTLVISPTPVDNPDDIATSDTDLHLAPAFAQARTLRADEGLEQVRKLGTIPPARLHDHADHAGTARIKITHPEILDEATAVSGELPRRSRLVWAVVALVAAAVGVVIGVIVGTR